MGLAVARGVKYQVETAKLRYLQKLHCNTEAPLILSIMCRL